MLKRLAIFLIILTFISCGEKEIKQPETTTTTNKNEDQLEQLLTLNDNEFLVAVIKTNMGTMEVELFSKQVPVTVKNFVGLASQNYYEGVTFHRVIDSFMIQGGDPTGTGSGGESYYGKKFNDEFNPSLLHDKPGVLSMANAGPNTNGSQFFITLVPTPWLNGKHSVFGQVINGMDVLQQIGKVKTTKPFDKPVNEVVMESVIIEKRAK